LEPMIDLAQLVRTRKTLGGRRLGVISNSGGLGVMTAETAVEAGFSLDDLSLENRSRLSSILPSFASVMNPVDVTAQLLNDPMLMAKTLPVMFEDEGVDAIVVSLGAVGDGYDIDQILEDVVTAHQSSDKIFLLVWVGSQIDIREDIGRQGVPIYESVTDALEALRDYANLHSGVQNIERAEGPQTPAFNHLFIGATYESSPLTLDECAVNAYADAAKQLGDDGNVHVSIDAAIAAGHEGRVVSGLHTLTQLTIAGERLGLWEHSKAVAGFKDVRFLTPVIEGQQVAVTFTVTGLKPLKDTGSGLVTFDFKVSRTDDEDGRPAAVGEVTYVFHGAGE
jgi:acyl dehydratase